MFALVVALGIVARVLYMSSDEHHGERAQLAMALLVLVGLYLVLCHITLDVLNTRDRTALASFEQKYRQSHRTSGLYREFCMLSSPSFASLPR
jgi:hypothetical protein